MGDLFREQAKLRWGIGAAIVLLVWILYGVRVIGGVGPMHDEAGNQAPVEHYLVGALAGTGMVVGWLVLRAIMTRRLKGR